MTRHTPLRRTTIAIPLGLLFAVLGKHTANAYATPPAPAHWSVTGMPTKSFAPGANFTLTLNAQIQPRWHIYALEEPEGGPIPTQIGLAEGDPLTLLSVEEPKPQMVRDPVLHQSTGMFQTSVNFTLHVQAPPTPPKPGAASTILVRYQSCNDQVCLAPRTETLRVPLAN